MHSSTNIPDCAAGECNQHIEALWCKDGNKPAGYQHVGQHSPNQHRRSSDREQGSMLDADLEMERVVSGQELALAVLVQVLEQVLVQAKVLAEQVQAWVLVELALVPVVSPSCLLWKIPCT